MLPTDPVTYKTPDGVERALRFTLGARKRIAIAFPGCGSDVQVALAQCGDGALPEIAYACMYDEDGNPPVGLTAARLAESLDGDDAIALMAAVMSAAGKGRTPKNEIEALLRKAQQTEIERLTGISFGASPGSASESQPANSGASLSENSMPSATGTESASGSPTIAAA